MDGIVYTSNTGYTARYAALLGEKTGLPVFSRIARKLACTASRSTVTWLCAQSIPLPPFIIYNCTIPAAPRQSPASRRRCSSSDTAKYMVS